MNVSSAIQSSSKNAGQILTCDITRVFSRDILGAEGMLDMEMLLFIDDWREGILDMETLLYIDDWREGMLDIETVLFIDDWRDGVKDAAIALASDATTFSSDSLGAE